MKEDWSLIAHMVTFTSAERSVKVSRSATGKNLLHLPPSVNAMLIYLQEQGIELGGL